MNIAIHTTDTLPNLISRAAAALSAAMGSGEVLEARDLAIVAYDAAKSAGRMARAKKAHDDVIGAVYRAQADALMIEARAKMRLADEYDAAQDRGEVLAHGQKRADVGNDNISTAADLGLRRDEIHEARKLRDAERESPGLIQQTLQAMVRPKATPQDPNPKPIEPTRAALQRSIVAAVADAKRQPDRKNPAQVKNPARDAVLSFIDHCEQLSLTRNLQAIASYADPMFPTTAQRLDRCAADALEILTRFMEARHA